jgi:hypothetical protein
MNLRFISLLSFLLFLLGLILQVAAIRPFTSRLAIVFIVLGVIGLSAQLIRNRQAKPKV